MITLEKWKEIVKKIKESGEFSTREKEELVRIIREYQKNQATQEGPTLAGKLPGC
ncbi:hypothetical protein J7K42_00410 [bacterium]|nr:hypothetical protein [bacterium]